MTNDQASNDASEAAWLPAEHGRRRRGHRHRKPDGSRYTMDEAARALLRPVNVVENLDA